MDTENWKKEELFSVRRSMPKISDNTYCQQPSAQKQQQQFCSVAINK